MIDIGTALEPCVSLQIMAMGINHEHINNCRPKEDILQPTPDEKVADEYARA